MKTMLIAFFAALVLQAAPAFADPPADSPLVGRWAIDVATLPIPKEKRPKSVLLEFRDPGNGKWSTQIEILNPGGDKMHAESMPSLDGTPDTRTGDYWADVVAVKMPAPNVLVMQLADHGKPASTRVYSVAGDGNTLTETKAFFTADGIPVLQTNTFTRVQP